MTRKYTDKSHFIKCSCLCKQRNVNRKETLTLRIHLLTVKIRAIRVIRGSDKNAVKIRAIRGSDNTPPYFTHPSTTPKHLLSAYFRAIRAIRGSDKNAVKIRVIRVIRGSNNPTVQKTF